MALTPSVTDAWDDGKCGRASMLGDFRKAWTPYCFRLRSNQK
jgi:hypothetical protein